MSRFAGIDIPNDFLDELGNDTIVVVITNNNPTLFKGSYSQFREKMLQGKFLNYLLIDVNSKYQEINSIKTNVVILGYNEDIELVDTSFYLSPDNSVKEREDS